LGYEVVVDSKTKHNQCFVWNSTFSIRTLLEGDTHSSRNGISLWISSLSDRSSTWMITIGELSSQTVYQRVLRHLVYVQ